jgi:hypothetical protein
MTYDKSCNDKILPRGDSRRWKVLVREPDRGDDDADGQPIDLTGSTIVFEMKRQPERNRLQPTDEVVVRKTSDDANEIEVLDQVTDTGYCRIRIIGSDTEFLAPGTYAYSIRVVTALGDPYTVVSARIFLRGPATAAENTTPPCR